jgi:PPOX class probable F420-dependent enzyme
MLTDAVRAYLARARVARLATVDAQGQPHVIPIVFAFASTLLYTPLDAKPKSVADVRQLQRVHNLITHPQIAVIVDDYDENWSRLRWVQIRGLARLVENGEEQERGLQLLRAKYLQYRTTTPLSDDSPVIIITPQHVGTWGFL